jgi:hypothetical protein
MFMEDVVGLYQVDGADEIMIADKGERHALAVHG